MASDLLTTKSEPKRVSRRTGAPPVEQQLAGWIDTPSGRTYIGRPNPESVKWAQAVAVELGRYLCQR